MCRVYGVTRAGFYAWRRAGCSRRRADNAALLPCIRAIHAASRGTYGSPWVYKALRRQGCVVSEKRVAGLMREHGIKARVAKLRYTNPALVRYFDLKVGSLWRYLAVVLDKYSRRVLGWSFGKHKDVRLTLRALNRAWAKRRPKAGLVFHTDRGIEYAAQAFKDRLAELKITQSMNRPGKVTDNAYIESFFHSLKTDVVHGVRFAEDREVQAVVRSYIPFYNTARLTHH